jgi:hypothetical protein
VDILPCYSEKKEGEIDYNLMMTMKFIFAYDIFITLCVFIPRIYCFIIYLLI